MKELFNYWNSRYASGGNSGAGSYNKEALMKSKVINEWIDKYNMGHIMEVGSGDGANLLLYNIPKTYTGYDISPSAVALCEERIRPLSNRPNYIITYDKDLINYSAHVLFLLDIWYHQCEDEDFDDLCFQAFERGSWKYIIIYSTDTDSDMVKVDDGTYMKQASHMRQRKVREVVNKYPNWTIIQELTEYTTANANTYEFPNDKKMFLLQRNKL